MDLTLSLFLVLFIGIVQGNDNRYAGDAIESEGKIDNGDQEVLESYGSPVYGPSAGAKSGGLPPSPKSGYPLPAPVPAGYLNGLGYGYGIAPYSRGGLLPYTSPFYGYGSPYNALPYGYGPGLASILGYSAGLSYGNPAFGRAGYAVYGNGYPGYAGLGYRYNGLGYNSAYFRAPGVPAPVPAAYGPVPVPATYAGIPAAYAAAPGAIPVPPVAAVGRPPVVATQGKDGSVRYSVIPPAGQRLTGY